MHTVVALCWRRQWHPLQYSCLENPMDGGAWWATVHWVAKSRTRLMRLSSSSSSGPSVIRLTSFLWIWFQCVCPLMPSCNTYHLTWVSLTLGVGYLFTAALAKRSQCSLPKLMYIESVMPSNHLILCHPLLLLPSVFPSIRIFSDDSALHIRWRHQKDRVYEKEGSLL